VLYIGIQGLIKGFWVEFLYSVGYILCFIVYVFTITVKKQG